MSAGLYDDGEPYYGGPLTMQILDACVGEGKMTNLVWNTVKSSNVDAVAHDGDCFYVRFKSGAEYHCPGIESRHLGEMVRAASPGRYFAQNLKPHYEFKRLEKAAMSEDSKPAGDTVYINRVAFQVALNAAMAAAMNGSDAPEGGNRVAMHPTPFRMALELREAIKRANGGHVEVAVQGWGEMLHTLKPPYPGGSAKEE